MSCVLRAHWVLKQKNKTLSQSNTPYGIQHTVQKVFGARALVQHDMHALSVMVCGCITTDEVCPWGMELDKKVVVYKDCSFQTHGAPD